MHNVFCLVNPALDRNMFIFKVAAFMKRATVFYPSLRIFNMAFAGCGYVPCGHDTPDIQGDICSSTLNRFRDTGHRWFILQRGHEHTRTGN